jgi:hypothetical protein
MGLGSPAELAKTFAKSYKQYRETGLTEFESSEKVFLEYIRSYKMMGLSINQRVIEDTVSDSFGDPALVCFALLLIGNSNNTETVKRIDKDADLIFKIILEEQNNVLGENRTRQSLEEKHQQ